MHRGWAIYRPSIFALLPATYIKKSETKRYKNRRMSIWSASRKILFRIQRSFHTKIQT